MSVTENKCIIMQLDLVNFGWSWVGWVLVVHDPPQHKETRWDPITSSFTHCDLTSLFPIGLLYLGNHPALYKEIALVTGKKFHWSWKRERRTEDVKYISSIRRSRGGEFIGDICAADAKRRARGKEAGEWQTIVRNLSWWGTAHVGRHVCWSCSAKTSSPRCTSPPCLRRTWRT